MGDNRSQAVGGEYWLETIRRDSDATNILHEAGERLVSAWDEAKELAAKLPEISRLQNAKLEKMRQEGF
jgi:hypothetical protein